MLMRARKALAAAALAAATLSTATPADASGLPTVEHSMWLYSPTGAIVCKEQIWGMAAHNSVQFTAYRLNAWAGRVSLSVTNYATGFTQTAVGIGIGGATPNVPNVGGFDVVHSGMIGARVCGEHVRVRLDWQQW